MRRTSPLLLGSSLAALLIAAAAACSGTSTTSGIAPPTGILVRSEALVSGVGCGTEPSQVFKFAAVVSDADGAVLGGTTYDCFADGSFQNLPPSASGSYRYHVDVFAYDRATYTASAASIENAAADPVRLASLPSTWTTTCEATQEADVEVIALCQPLATSPSRLPGSVRVPTEAFAAAGDAGAATFACGSDFTSVATTTSVDAGATTSVDCPSPLIADGLAPGSAYSADLELLFAGVRVATTTCRATVKEGVEVTATCDPARKP